MSKLSLQDKAWLSRCLDEPCYDYPLRKAVLEAVLLMNGQEQPVQKLVAEFYADWIVNYLNSEYVSAVNSSIKFSFSSGKPCPPELLLIRNFFKASILANKGRAKEYGVLLLNFEQTKTVAGCIDWIFDGLRTACTVASLKGQIDLRVLKKNEENLVGHQPTRHQRNFNAIKRLLLYINGYLLLHSIINDVLAKPSTYSASFGLFALLAIATIFFDKLALTSYSVYRFRNLIKANLHINLDQAFSDNLLANKTKIAVAVVKEQKADDHESYQGATLAVTLSDQGDLISPEDQAPLYHTVVSSEERREKIKRRPASELVSAAAGPAVVPADVEAVTSPGFFGHQYDYLDKKYLCKLYGVGLGAESTYYAIWDRNQIDKSSDGQYEEELKELERIFATGKLIPPRATNGIKLLRNLDYFEIKTSKGLYRVIGDTRVCENGCTAIVFTHFLPSGLHKKHVAANYQVITPRPSRM